MRRSGFFIAVAGFFVAGCETANPIAPRSAEAGGISAEVRNDSTPRGGASSPTSGGILIGSGT